MKWCTDKITKSNTYTIKAIYDEQQTRMNEWIKLDMTDLYI